MLVTCGLLCNDDDEFLIRMFDKDSLLIDFAAYGIKTDTYICGDKYIIPADVRKDIVYMEIIPLSDNGEAKYEVWCDEGYTLDSESNTCVKQKSPPSGGRY